MFDLFLCHLLGRFHSTKEDIKADGAGIQRGFLRHKSDLLPVRLDIELRNLLTVQLKNHSVNYPVENICGITYINLSSKRIIKPFNHLNAAKSFSATIDTDFRGKNLHSTLPASTSTNQSDICSRFDFQAEIPQHADIWSRWIPEVDILKLDMALDLGIIENIAFR